MSGLGKGVSGMVGISRNGSGAGTFPDRLAVQTVLMASFFKKNPPLHSTVFLPTRVNPPALETLPRLQEHTIEPQPSNRQTSSPLSVLSDIASHLPNTIPSAIPSDTIASLTGNPKEMVSNRLLEDLDEDPYEWLDKSLNGIWGKSDW